MGTITDLFRECYKPETPKTQYQTTHQLSEKDLLVIADFKVYFNNPLYGITVDKTRYITDGAYLICGMAIALSDAWKVFRTLFEELGDNWLLEPHASEAKPCNDPNMGERDRQIIDSWTEEKGEQDLNLIATVLHYCLYSNSEGKLVLVGENYHRFISEWHFYLNDTLDPFAPMTLTHCHSGGFAGLLMPCKVEPSWIAGTKEKLQQAVELLAANE